MSRGDGAVRLLAEVNAYKKRRAIHALLGREAYRSSRFLAAALLRLADISMELALLFNRRRRAGLTTVKCPGDANTEPRQHAPGANLAGDLPAAVDKDRPRSVIATLLSIEGDLESQGDVLVDGRIRGNVTCKRLTVGPDGSIEGDILADEAVICGKVTGPIRAASVRVEATAHVEGYIYHATLSIEAGAIFQGVSRCRKNPKSTDVATERQVAELNAKAAEMMAEAQSEHPQLEPESMAMLPGLSPPAPLAVKRKGNGRKAALA